MATVQIADVYDPLRFSTMAQESQVEKNSFIQSGVQVANSDLSAACSMSGWLGEIDNIKPLTLDEPNYSSDVKTDNKDSAKLGTQQMKYRKAARTKSWSAMDIARGIGLQDPVTGITARIAAYWANDLEKRAIYSLQGVMLDNIANDGGDMVLDAFNDDAAAIADSEKAGALNFIKAFALKGDRLGSIAAIGIHSAIYYSLLSMNLIATERDSTNAEFSTYQGKRVIVDDSLIVTMGTNRPVYTSILFGYGLIHAGEGNMPNTQGSELERDAAAGNGSGETTLYSRRTDVSMIIGFSWTDTNVAGLTATWAELQDPANWDRVWDAKNIPLSFLRTNG